MVKPQNGKVEIIKYIGKPLRKGRQRKLLHISSSDGVSLFPYYTGFFGKLQGGIAPMRKNAARNLILVAY